MTEELRRGQTVYTIAGTELAYSHTHGDRAYCHPIVINQITNYRGDDFEEVEVEADHLVDMPLKNVFTRPPLDKVHAETVAAVAEKKAKLKELDADIGTATRAKHQAERDLEEFQRDAEKRLAVLKRKYAWVQQAEALMSPDVCGLTGIDMIEVPGATSRPITRFNVYRTENKGIFEVHIGDTPSEIFATEAAREKRVRQLYAQRDVSDVEITIKWCKEYPYLTPDPAARAEAERAADADKAQKRRMREAELVKLKEKYDALHAEMQEDEEVSVQ